MQFNRQTGSFHLIFILQIPAGEHHACHHGDCTGTPAMTFLLLQYPLMAAPCAHSSIAITTSGLNDRRDPPLISFCGRTVRGRRLGDAGNSVGLMGNVTLC